MYIHKLYSLTILSFLFCTLSFAQQYDPIADPASIVRSGHARFTILTDHVIRMEYAYDSAFTDQASLTIVNRKLPVPAYQVSDSNGWLIIKTKYSTLHYLKNSGPLTSRNLYID